MNVNGSLTTDLTADELCALFGTGPFKQPFTLTATTRVRWWKRPWYWLRRKPTRTIRVYGDIVVAAFTINDDGSVDFKTHPDSGKQLPQLDGKIVCARGHLMRRRQRPGDVLLDCGCVATEASDEVLASRGVTRAQIDARVLRELLEPYRVELDGFETPRRWI